MQANTWPRVLLSLRKYRAHFQQAGFHGSKVALHLLQTDVAVVNLLPAHLIFGHVTGDHVAASQFQGPRGREADCKIVSGRGVVHGKGTAAEAGFLQRECACGADLGDSPRGTWQGFDQGSAERDRD